MIPTHATIEDVRTIVSTYPYVEKASVIESPTDAGVLLVSVRVRDRERFDEAGLIVALRGYLPVGIEARLEVNKGMWRDEDAPRSFARSRKIDRTYVSHRDYDPDMSDDELRLRLQKQRG